MQTNRTFPRCSGAVRATGAGGQHTDFCGTPDAGFDGNRWNDLHYSNAVKRVAPRCSHPRERMS